MTASTFNALAAARVLKAAGIEAAIAHPAGPSGTLPSGLRPGNRSPGRTRHDLDYRH